MRLIVRAMVMIVATLVAGTLLAGPAAAEKELRLATSRRMLSRFTSSIRPAYQQRQASMLRLCVFEPKMYLQRQPALERGDQMSNTAEITIRRLDHAADASALARLAGKDTRPAPPGRRARRLCRRRAPGRDGTVQRSSDR